MKAVRKQIYHFLLESIAKGRYALNDRIPTEQELGGMFSTHRMDARYAVKTLEEHGILRRQRKNGTFVSRIPADFLMGELKSLATRRVCVMNTTPPEYQHIHWNQRLIRPLEDGLRKADIEVQFENVSTLKTADEYRQFLAAQIARGINALLLVPRSTDDQNPILNQPELLFEFHNNVFIFDRGVHNWSAWPYNIVSINVFGEGVLVAEHLVNKNIRHVIFCYRDSIKRPWMTERMNGLRYGLYRGNRDIMCSEYNLDQPNPEFFQKIQQCIGEGSTAIVGQNDELAAAIIKDASAYGLTAGRDMAVIGFDDNDQYRSFNLTTVSPSLERVGQHLAELISDSLDSDDLREPTCTKVNSELKVRATG